MVVRRTIHKAPRNIYFGTSMIIKNGYLLFRYTRLKVGCIIGYRFREALINSQSQIL